MIFSLRLRAFRHLHVFRKWKFLSSQPSTHPPPNLRLIIFCQKLALHILMILRSRNHLHQRLCHLRTVELSFLLGPKLEICMRKPDQKYQTATQILSQRPKKSKITVITWWSWNFPTSTPLRPWRPAQLANLLLLWEKTAALHHRQKLFHRKVTTSNPPKNRCILGLFWLKSLQCWQRWTLGCMKHFNNWWAMAMNDWFDLVFCQIHGSSGFFGGKSPLIFVTRADDCLRAPFSLKKDLVDNSQHNKSFIPGHLHKIVDKLLLCLAVEAKAWFHEAAYVDLWNYHHTQTIQILKQHHHITISIGTPGLSKPPLCSRRNSRVQDPRFLFSCPVAMLLPRSYGLHRHLWRDLLG